MQKNILTIDEAAKLLNRHRQTMFSYINKQKLKGFKIGLKWHFERAEVERFLKEEIRVK